MLKIVQRMNTLAKVSQAIARGEYTRRAPVKGKDELAVLATNVNQMADAILLRINEVTRLNQNLEARVAARTRDLLEVNTTLARTVDELKWAQESLVRSEKLAGLGALVAGVAHELNTPVGNALTVASTLQDYTRTINAEFKSALRRASLEKFLEEATLASELIVRNLQRTAELVTSFKHVAVDQVSENRREFELRTTLLEIIATLSPMLKKTPYRLELSIEDGIVMNSYPGALGQIISNLVNNALLHAFSDREQGVMRLCVTALETKEVKLEFSDDGVGMTEDTLRHIFDPFFTTRFGQGGSGLGMSIVHNLVSVLLGGSIDVQSVPGEGTRFTLFLPVRV
jgi:signal transduction histidine kinase